MKKTRLVLVLVFIMAVFAACGDSNTGTYTDAVQIDLSDNAIKVNGEAAGTDSEAAVYISNDIVYYEEGHDFTYGEGTEADAHSAEEAAAHTVVNITKPGNYALNGNLSKGQIAVDLGEEAEDDPEAVVTLILDSVDITCEVAPAVIFYNVYECGEADEETASKDVDTSAAGANVVIADRMTNNITGSYVARIYKPGTVELSEDGTEVADAKKLHKYDAAFYSRMTMNVDGGEKGTGVLNINAENEGLDSELHLTINGGTINIKSGNDGINTNEDYVSVTTINGGVVNIEVTGETGEGDGIDSNGWLVINGGTVIAAACAGSADAGIDSDMGIHINGGTVIATGHMLDRIEDGGQKYQVFNFNGMQNGGEAIELKNDAEETIAEITPANDYSVLIYSAPDLEDGGYTIWKDGEQIEARNGGMMPGGPGMGGGMRPGGMMPEGVTPGGMVPPEGFDPANRPEPPEGFDPENMPEPPEGFDPPPERPDDPEADTAE